MYRIRDKIVKKPCYLAKVCAREFKKKQVWGKLFSLQLSVHEYRLTILCERGTKLFQEVRDNFLKIPG